MKGFALRLALKQRQKATRKSAILRVQFIDISGWKIPHRGPFSMGAIIRASQIAKPPQPSIENDS